MNVAPEVLPTCEKLETILAKYNIDATTKPAQPNEKELYPVEPGEGKIACWNKENNIVLIEFNASTLPAKDRGNISWETYASIEDEITKYIKG